MRRREFIVGLGGAPAWPIAARGQPAKNPVRIGFLPFGSPSNAYDQSLVESFQQGLREVGVLDHRDVVLDLVWINDETELPQAVRELMQRGAQLLITVGTSASMAAKRQVSMIPILLCSEASCHSSG
jgi:putative tryptophan/tyrosine transport system substrate-binding protein